MHLHFRCLSAGASWLAGPGLFCKQNPNCYRCTKEASCPNDPRIDWTVLFLYNSFWPNSSPTSYVLSLNISKIWIGWQNFLNGSTLSMLFYTMRDQATFFGGWGISSRESTHIGFCFNVFFWLTEDIIIYYNCPQLWHHMAHRKFNCSIGHKRIKFEKTANPEGLCLVLLYLCKLLIKHPLCTFSGELYFKKSWSVTQWRIKQIY
jgi:hypothetical protein